jgi:hypothetical protein
MRRLAAVFIASTLLMSVSQPPAFADPPDHLYQIPSGPPVDTQVATWMESNTSSTRFSFSPFDERNSATNRQQALNSFDTVLGVCAPTNNVGCIESVRYSADGFTWYTATLARNLDQRFWAYYNMTDSQGEAHQLTSTWPADPARGLFQASLPNEFSLPNAPHAIGSEYLINATAISKVVDGVARMQGIELEAIAGRVKTDSAECDYWRVETSIVQPRNYYCYEPVDLPENLQLEVNVELGSRISELSGWFDGRLMNPSITFGNATSPGRISVKGSPLKVNYFETAPIPKGHSLFDVPDYVNEIQKQGGIGTRGSSSPRTGLNSFLRLESFVPNASAEIDTVWKLNSWTNNVGISQCASNPGIQGIIITNATTYSPNPPSFDALTGNLNFQVASTHFLPDGTSTNLGYYKLFLQEKLANCLWGTSDISSAAITVKEPSGVANQATTSAEKVNGWLSFTASNYHYSAPKISVGVPSALTAIPANYKAKKTLTVKAMTGSNAKIKVKVKGSCSVKAIKKTTSKKVGKKKVKTTTIVSYKVKFGKKGKRCTITQTAPATATSPSLKSVSIVKIN